MSIDLDQNRLSQIEKMNMLQCRQKMTDMVTVYLSDREYLHDYAIYCALIPSNKIEKIVSETYWDLLHGDALPDTMMYHEGENKRVEYLRYGNDNGIEPLVIEREFGGIREGYKEICEEFRLFHRLYHDRIKEHYIKIDDSGNEHLVAVVEAKRIQIRLKEIRQFLALKEMHLSIQFDYLEFSEYSLEELDLQTSDNEHYGNLLCWKYQYSNSDRISKYQTFSGLSGKYLIPPLPKSKSGMWGFAEEQKKQYVEFIIDIDDSGEKIIYTSNPNKLAGKVGAAPDAPGYLTPIYFDKQVLDKYYQQPSKYSVEDSILHCGSLWGMYLDNHHDDKICAWLGDLGCKLPYEEQLHWRACNILPEGSISETYYRRQILGQFTDSDRDDHLFKQRYDDLKVACDECLGWQLLLPLNADDEHHFQGLRIPATDEQRDFDELVLSLTKILIDSLNEGSLKKLTLAQQQSDIKGISLLEAVCNIYKIDDASHHILFLRKLQNLRSSSVAHRKGKKYRKIAKEFNIDSESLRSVFSEILVQALGFLDYLITIVRDGRFEKQEYGDSI